MPRHFAHSIEHARVLDSTLCELCAHHFFALSLKRIALEREAHGSCVACSVRADDSANVARSGRLKPHRPFLRSDHVEILVGRARIEEHNLVFLAEEAAGAQLPIGNE